MSRIISSASSARIGLVPLLAFACVMALWGCSKGDADPLDDDAAPVESEDEAHRVQLQFDGVFRNASNVYDEDLITELELRNEGLQQRRNGYVVFDAPCTKEVTSKRRVDYNCVTEDEQITLWPLAFTPDGALYHRAMPEMLYLRVEEDVPDGSEASDVHDTP